MRLLIAYDGSEEMDTKLDDLERAGLPDRCETILLSVIDSWLPPLDTVSSDAQPIAFLHRETFERMQLRQVEVERLAERLRQRFPNWQVTEEVRADSPGWAIIRRAEGWENECHADLVVLGTTDKSIVSRMLLGSVSQQVMTFARCSVRIVRPRGTSASRVSRLVIGVDGSPNADWAVQAICRRVWVAGSEARVVCVPNSKMMAIPHIKALGVTSTKAAAEVIVERATLELRAAGLAVASYVTEGEPKHELVKQAEEFAADCLVVGARGLTRMERILLGSVSLAVAMRASCSVEVVRTAARSDVDLTLAECPL